jgi:hypothetical protein
MCGSNSMSYPIAVKGGYMCVSKNLWEFLMVIHSQKDFETWYWIDQVSIDQHNIGQRNRQVQMMAKIYVKRVKCAFGLARLELMIIWL